MPSKVILEQKQQAVADLAEKIKNSVSGVLVNYQGITVEDDTADLLLFAFSLYLAAKNAGVFFPAPTAQTAEPTTEPAPKDPE